MEILNCTIKPLDKFNSGTDWSECEMNGEIWFCLCKIQNWGQTSLCCWICSEPLGFGLTRELIEKNGDTNSYQAVVKTSLCKENFFFPSFGHFLYGDFMECRHIIFVISPPAISCRQEGDAAGRIPPCRPLPKLSASSCTLACKINLSKYLERVCWSYTSFRGISMLPLILSDESMDWIHWRRCCWAFIKCQIIFRAEAFLCKIYSQLTITVSKLQNFSIWLFLFNW